MIEAETISQELAAKRRTLVLGGAAVIFYGLNRSTKDLDLWTDPNPTPQHWAEPIEAVLQSHPEISAVYLDDGTGQWERIKRGEIARVPGQGRILRLLNCDRPIDIFHQPNEVELGEFDAFWERGKPLAGGARALDLIDLIITKQLTNRPHDQADIAFLEAKIEAELCAQLPGQSYEYAVAQLRRFQSAKVALSATTNPDPKVRELGMSILNESAQKGDPFAQEFLDRIRQQT